MPNLYNRLTIPTPATVTKAEKGKGLFCKHTETCDDSRDSDEQPLNLITDVNLDEVSTLDCEFLEPSIKAMQRLLDNKIEEIYADGAYNSGGTQDYAGVNDMDLILTGTRGTASWV